MGDQAASPLVRVHVIGRQLVPADGPPIPLLKTEIALSRVPGLGEVVILENRPFIVRTVSHRPMPFHNAVASLVMADVFANEVTTENLNKIMDADE